MNGYDLLLNAGGMLVAAGVAYGAIRGDLRAIHEHLRDLREDITRAHKRIDFLKGK